MKTRKEQNGRHAGDDAAPIDAIDPAPNMIIRWDGNMAVRSAAFYLGAG